MLYTSSGQSHKRKLCFKQDILRQTSTSGKVTFQSNFKFQDDNTKFLNLPATNINVTLQSSGLSNAGTPKYWVGLSNPRHWNAGLVSSGVSITSWREGISLGLAGHHSSDCVAIKIPYGLWGKCFITSTSLTLIFSYWVGYN